MLYRSALFLLAFNFISNVYAAQRVAVAHLMNDVVSGSIYFTEIDDGLRVTGNITGLEAGHYGFHIHELGDASTCDATGAHFNPENVVHGGRDHEVRHVGDLGNVQFVANGNDAPVASFDFIDTLITLRGRNDILGRSLVLHANIDDLGLGGHDDSLTTGNAGPRIACGVIGINSPSDWNSAASNSPSMMLFVSALGIIFRYFYV